MPRKSLSTEPQIIEMPRQRMAVVRAKGPPDKVFPQVFPALFGAVYTLKFDLKKRGLSTFKVSPPRSRYPDALDKPKSKWTIITGIPIPGDTDSLPQKVPGVKVQVEDWEYGTVAQVLHLGAYDKEQPSVERLHQFIQSNGYELCGPHEEEYLSRPDAKVLKTIIRYQVRKVLPRRG